MRVRSILALLYYTGPMGQKVGNVTFDPWGVGL